LNLDPSYIRRGLHQWEARARKSVQAKQRKNIANEQRLVA
jgi:hypothetical protein